MDNVILKRSGTLCDGTFFEFYVPVGDDLMGMEYEPAEADVVVRRDPTDIQLIATGRGNYISAEIESSEGADFRRGCSSDNSHYTEQFWKRLQISISGGPAVTDLMHAHLDHGQFAVIVTDSFATRLKASGLTGFRLESATVDDTLSRAANPGFNCPKLYDLQFRGKKCFRPLSIVGAPNTCPFCGRAPLVCTECGQVFMFCERCRNAAWIPRPKHQGPGDKRLIAAGYSQWRPPIVEARKWDGSDFIFGSFDIGLWTHVVTKRVVDWLLSVHAAPFVAKPIPVCVDGITEETKQRLAEAVKPPRPDLAKGSSK